MQFLLNGLIGGSTYALVALSFSLIYTPTRFFHFAHGAVYAWGAYFAYTCHMVLKLPIWVAIPLGVLGAAGLGLMVEGLVYRPLRRRGGDGVGVTVGIFGALCRAAELDFASVWG